MKEFDTNRKESRNKATQCDTMEFLSAMTSRDQGVQTAVLNWEYISKEVAYLIRMYRLLTQLKTLRELHEIGRKEFLT